MTRGRESKREGRKVTVGQVLIKSEIERGYGKEEGSNEWVVVSLKRLTWPRIFPLKCGTLYIGLYIKLTDMARYFRQDKSTQFPISLMKGPLIQINTNYNNDNNIKRMKGF